MSFQQLYYTSCKHGLSGYAGFQFNAVSDGVNPRIMRRVEQLTVYDRPSRTVEFGDEPVNLCHALDEATGTAVTAQVVYTGLDPSGRPGNYFAHALATDDPQHDFSELRPVELWGSPVWRAEVAATTSLPLLDQPPQAGPLDRVVVAEFLAGRGGPTELLATLLTAADRAAAGGRPVILRGATSEANALWIAAVSYLLSDAQARGLSFATYSRRPDRTRTHIVGTVPDPDSDAVTAGLTESFSVFDLVDHRPADVEPHPLALLLAEAGPVHAAGLWRQAMTLAAGNERTLEDWHPVVAAAHALMGRQPALPPMTLEATARWLPSAIVRPAPLPNRRAEAVLRVILERALELSSNELRKLASVAQRTGAQDQLHAIDSVLLDRAMQALRSGQTPEASDTPLTADVRKDAALRCEPVLAAADANGALTVLDWARTSAVQIQPELVQQCGRDVIGPALERLQNDKRLERVGTRNPPLLRGLAQNLANGTPQRAQDLLGGVTGRLLDDADLTAFSPLRELILVEEVQQGQLAPLDALREVTELRHPTSPLADAELLRRLWPNERWTPPEARQVLSQFKNVASGTPALHYLSRALDPPEDPADLDDWLALIDAVWSHPVRPMLSGTTLALVNDMAGMGAVLREATAAAQRGEPAWYRTLDARVRSQSSAAQRALRPRLATLIISCPEPAAPLAKCPTPVFDACCKLAFDRLRQEPIDHDLCARLVTAVSTWDVGSSRYEYLGVRILRHSMLTWSRRDRKAVHRLLKDAEGRGFTTSVILRITRAPQDPSASLETFHRLLSETNGARTNLTVHRDL